MGEQGRKKKHDKNGGGEKNLKNQCGLTFTHNTVLAREEMDEQGQL